MNAKQIAALNAAGEALKDLNLGRVSVTYHPPCAMIPRESFTVNVGAAASITVGEGATIAEALGNLLRQTTPALAKVA